MLRPIRNWILVRLDPRDSTYLPGGKIETHDLSHVQPTTAEVLAVGPGSKESPMECQVGDRVLLGKWNGKPVPGHLVDPSDPHSERYWLLDTTHDKPKPHVPDVYGVIVP